MEFADQGLSDLKKITDLLTNEEDTKERKKKFFSQFFLQNEGNEISHFPDFLTKRLSSNLDILKMSLNQQDLQISSQIFNRREEDLKRKLQNVEFEIDFGSHEFQKRFYQKYVLIKYK